MKYLMEPVVMPRLLMLVGRVIFGSWLVLVVQAMT
jgi:hypothetical protein